MCGAPGLCSVLAYTKQGYDETCLVQGISHRKKKLSGGAFYLLRPLLNVLT